MTVEELRNNVESTKEKLKALEEKAFKDDKGRYPIIKNQIIINLGDIEFIEKHMDRNNDEEDMELYTELLEHINRTADLDLEKFVKENQLDTPVGEALVAFQMAAMDVEKGLTEEEKNVEIPPVESIIEKAEEANELDQVDTNAIVDSLGNEPVEEVEPIPQELVDEMLAQDEAAKAEATEEVVEEAPVEESTEEVGEAIPVEDVQPEVVEATPEVAPVVEEAPVAETPAEETIVAPEVQPEAPVQEVANVPTQDVNIAAIDDILNTLDAPVQEAPVAEQAVEETVATPVDVPPMEEAVATPEVTPVVEAPTQEAVAAPVDVPPMEEAVAAPEVATQVVETPVAEEVIAAPEPAPAAPEVAPVVEAPVAPSPVVEQAVEQVVQEVAQDVVAAPAMPEAAPVVEGQSLTM